MSLLNPIIRVSSQKLYRPMMHARSFTTENPHLHLINLFKKAKLAIRGVSSNETEFIKANRPQGNPLHSASMIFPEIPSEPTLVCGAGLGIEVSDNRNIHYISEEDACTGYGDKDPQMIGKIYTGFGYVPAPTPTFSTTENLYQHYLSIQQHRINTNSPQKRFEHNEIILKTLKAKDFVCVIYQERSTNEKEKHPFPIDISHGDGRTDSKLYPLLNAQAFLQAIQLQSLAETFNCHLHIFKLTLGHITPHEHSQNEVKEALKLFEEEYNRLKTSCLPDIIKTPAQLKKDVLTLL